MGPFTNKSLINHQEYILFMSQEYGFFRIRHSTITNGSRSKVNLKSLIRDLDLELDSIIACLHPPTKLF